MWAGRARAGRARASSQQRWSDRLMHLNYVAFRIMEEDLVPKKKMAVAAALSVAFLVFIALIMMSSIRSPFPV